MNVRMFLSLSLLLMPVGEVLAKQDYTYVQSSLAFPWFMFFVFFALILIPFVMVIALAWGNPARGEEGSPDSVVSLPLAADNKVAKKGGVFHRYFLPAILVFVGVFSILLVMNAYEAMDLMEQYGTAAPTMLNARP